MGTPDFAVPTLERLLKSSHHVAGVVTQPDRPRGRGQQLKFTAVKEIAVQYNIPHIFQPESLKESEFLKNLKHLEADVFVVVAYRILPEVVFDMPRLGTINVHPSLLPKYRGAAPIQWSIINGEVETGVTIIKIAKQIDAGGIILQERVPVQPDETAGSLHDRLALMGADLLLQALEKMQSNDFAPIPQNDAEATPAPKLTREDCHLSFDQSCEAVKNRIHGLSPFPGAFAYLNSQRFNFYKAKSLPSEKSQEIPGTVMVSDKKRIIVSCKTGAVEILEIQREGKQRLPVKEFLKGYSIKSGQKFE
jgi:methionyl-tRNA formyltransferase